MQKEVWHEVNEKVRELSALKILAKFNIEYSAPCASLIEDLSNFDKSKGICPSLRGDDIVGVNKVFVEKLEQVTGTKIQSLADFEQAIEKRLEVFVEAGCKYSDHALDDGFDYETKTMLFTLNPADNAVMSILSGSYSKDGVEAIVSQGPAWWWCDHYQGMVEMLDHLSVFGVASTFVGMTTDSRSLMSFVRHDYFRRILCNWIGEKVEKDILPENEEILSEMIRNMCYYNAAKTVKEEK